MRVSDLDYELPEELIAQEPSPQREAARLLVLDRTSGRVQHRGIPDLPSRLRPSDLLVLNDTRVLPARLYAQRETGGHVRVLLLEPHANDASIWHAMVRAGGSLRQGEEIFLEEGEGIRLLEPSGAGEWLVEGSETDIRTIMARHGRMPLPPYIVRAPKDPREELDRERYQTTFAKREGAVAAPTAGLHLTPALLETMAERGIETTFVTLHVGYGTFEPLRTEHVEDHHMHEERYEVPAPAVAAIQHARSMGGRVVAVGTTTVRALEAAAAAAEDGPLRPHAGRTDLLIAPGHRFRVVDALLTNFHLPASSLLALVAAFAGLDRTMATYRKAVAKRYRFFSYGDAMLIL